MKKRLVFWLFTCGIVAVVGIISDTIAAKLMHFKGVESTILQELGYEIPQNITMGIAGLGLTILMFFMVTAMEQPKSVLYGLHALISGVAVVQISSLLTRGYVVDYFPIFHYGHANTGDLFLILGMLVLGVWYFLIPVPNEKK